MAETIMNSGSNMLLTLAITSLLFCPPQYSPEYAQITANSIPPIASFGADPAPERSAAPSTAQEMVANLRKGGMPVSAIADALRVERKSVYAWLEGGLVRPANAQRIALVHSLLTEVPGVSPRGLYRLWNTPIEGGKTLRELITTENIHEPEVKMLIERIRPTAQRLSLSEDRMRREGTTNVFLDEIPDVGTRG